MNGRDRDPPARDRGEIGPRLVLERGLEPVDLVPAAAVAVLADEPQLVVVEALAEPGHLDPLGLARGDVHVQQRLRGQGRAGQHPNQLGPDPGGDGEVEAPARKESHLLRASLLGDGDRRNPEHDPLERGGDRPRVGDVVAQVGAVVDARDDQVGPFAHQAEIGEADAVDRGAVGRVGDEAVVELDLLDRERGARRDAPRRGAAIGVGDDDVDLDPVDLHQRAPKGVHPLGADSVVVGEQDTHRVDSRDALVEHRRPSRSIRVT